MDANELRALADAIVYRDSLAIARAADYLRACADTQPVAWVDVTDSYEGPYIFRGKELLPAGRHDLYTRPAPAAPQAEPMADSDADYWLRNRQPILDAIERAGFMLMSNASGFWLHPRGTTEAQIERLHNALVIAAAALADIGDADREPGDDLAWCEQRAAEALPTIRAALAAKDRT